MTRRFRSPCSLCQYCYTKQYSEYLSATYAELSKRPPLAYVSSDISGKCWVHFRLPGLQFFHHILHRHSIYNPSGWILWVQDVVYVLLVQLLCCILYYALFINPFMVWILNLWYQFCMVAESHQLYALNEDAQWQSTIILTVVISLSLAEHISEQTFELPMISDVHVTSLLLGCAMLCCGFLLVDCSHINQGFFTGIWK